MQEIDDRTLISFDWAIKYTLRDKANFDVLEGFLSALLNEDIQVVGLLESEANQWDESDKFNRVDLMAADSQGVEFIVEVQYSYVRGYLQRLLFGTSKLITDSMRVGDGYDKVKKVISISLIYFMIGDQEKDKDYIYHGCTNFYGVHSQKQLSVRQDMLKNKRKKKDAPPVSIEEINKRNVFPEYYLISVERFPDEVKNAIDEWIYFFKHSEIPDEFHAKHIQTAREKLKVIKMKKGERDAYEKFQLARAKYQGEVGSAEEKGHAEGLAEGLEKGLEKGREEGKLETQREIARQMFANDIPASTIQQITGLSEKEITQLGEG